ncbi:MAG: methyltransferase domain-containing protein [Terrimicrobiaceae bacterium]
MSETCSNACDESRYEQIRGLYSDLALHPEKDFGWGKGVNNARALGYDPAWLERLPLAVWKSSAAVGNPFSIGTIHPGETVVDLGCGAGADVCVAALLVGSHGRVIGVDLAPAMVEKARANITLAGLRNGEIFEADIAELPIPNACADVVISNGAINLSPHKACVLKEANRVLKAGGRLYIADIVRDATAPQSQYETGSAKSSWANCIAGTLNPECFLEMLEAAGFADVVMVGTTGYRTSPETIGALFRAQKPRTD